jgi:hypothetical protein
LGRWAGRAGICYAITALVVAAVLTPLSYSKTKDSFPLSSFPMFARRQPSPTLVQLFLIAEGDDFRRSISPELVGSDEVLQAQATIRNAVRRGPRARSALCDEVAARVAREPSMDRARAVRLVKGRYNAIEVLSGRETGVERVLLSCGIPRQGDTR